VRNDTVRRDDKMNNIFTENDTKIIKYLENFGFRVEPKKESISKISLTVFKHGTSDTIELFSNNINEAIKTLDNYIDVFDLLLC
jgi:hypothetical protein